MTARSAILRLRCLGTVGEKALLGVKESMLGAYRSSSGQLLPEDRLITRVTGTITQDASAPAVYPSQVTVSLVAGGKPVGMLSLFSQHPQAFSEDDGVLLDTLANQTADAIQSLRAVEEEARRRIERMVESMADGVLLTDEKDAIVVINPAARRILQLGEDRAGGSPAACSRSASASSPSSSSAAGSTAARRCSTRGSGAVRAPHPVHRHPGERRAGHRCAASAWCCATSPSRRCSRSARTSSSPW